MIARTLFSAEHELFRATVQRFIAEHVTPYHLEWEHAGQVPRSLWTLAGELGLLCCNVPEAYGGMGGDFLHSTILVEEFAAAGATGPTFYLQSDIIAPYLVDFGSEEQKQRWLPRMASGEVVAALGMSEPSGGSDVQAMRTQALRDGDDYVINGQKVFITNGHSADLLLLACKTDPKARAMLSELNAQNRFALAFRVHNMKTEAGRKKKIADFVAMLRRGETIYPQRKKS